MVSAPIRWTGFEVFLILIRYDISGKATDAMDAILRISEILSDLMLGAYELINRTRRTRT
jgi:hypothetical protein